MADTSGIYGRISQTGWLAGPNASGARTNFLVINDDGSINITASIIGTTGLTDTQLRASPVPVTGTMAISGPVAVTGTFWQATQPISAAALPLPAGAATEATLDARTGALIETAPASDTASSGINGRLQRIAQRLTSLIGLLPSALTGSGNLKVSVAESTATVGVTQSGTWTVQPGNTANTTAWKVDGSAVTQPVSAASLPLPTGAGTSANQSTIITDLGGVTETAPASDTASSGLNGRLQRIAQRLTSLIAQLPASLGIKTAANSLSITHASDDSVLAATGTTADAAYAGSGGGTLISILKGLYAALIGRLTVDTESTKATYSAGGWNLAPAAAAQILVELRASSTKKIRLKRVILTGKATTAGSVVIGITKSSTQLTGGSPTAATMMPHDSTDAAATATVNSYTTNTATGATAVGTIGNRRLFLNLNTAVPHILEYVFGNANDKALVLAAGSTQMLGITMAGDTAPSGGVIDWWIEWTEE